MLQRWSFHVDYVDIWFKSRVDYPLCRVGIFRHESSFIPVMAVSIWLSLGDADLESIVFEPLSEAAPESKTAVTEIMPAELSLRRNPVWRQIQRIRFYIDEIVFIQLRPELPVGVAGDGMEGDVLWVRRVVPNEIDYCDGSSGVLRVKSSWMGLTARIDAIDGGP